nr:type VI secretion system tip protein TssI/VgrG [uncultured Massilia sp.]
MFATSDLPSVQDVLTSLARFSQSTRLLQLHTRLGPDVVLAESLHGDEGIDTGFRLQLSALSVNASLALKSLLGQPVLLELQASPGMAPRSFHGHVTAAELVGANGGLARYRLTIEPWTAFLALGRDSRVFQDKSVIDIIEAVFKAWPGRGQLAPSWRIDADRTLYPQRSLCTQYQESDLAFVQRLMSEEGLFAFFEHGGDPESATLGTHTLVIADSNDAFKPNPQPAARFTQAGAVMREDSIDRWRTDMRMGTNAVELRSWDYRSRSARPVGTSASSAVELRSSDVPGAYAYTSREHGERIAERQLQALEADKEIHTGAGTVRSFVPGTTFALEGHASADGDYLIVRMRHLAHNNLDADITSALHEHLGADPVATLGAAELADSLHAVGRRIAERPVYRNRFDAMPAARPYRSRRTDGHGHLLHPRPMVSGQQTAIVVGPAGAPIHTDRDHRIKVQFHWQRGDAAHNRLAHPAPDGHAGAPADDRAGTWVRVATPLAPVAGANWGSNALPRVGQEVLVDFMDGNIDRPVVIGAVYNGAGAPDAQHNRVAGGAGAATGNAGAWFPGEAGAHAHAAVLSGLKSQAMGASGDGSGAYSQLVFDDTPQQARVALQHHAKAHTGAAELNLGHLQHQSDNRRLGTTGFGAELKTEHGLALRAGRGMLLTADRAADTDPALDSDPAAAQVEQSHTVQADLEKAAGQHNARLPGESSTDELPAIAATGHAAEVLRATSSGGADGRLATAYSETQLQLSAPAGIAALTPASAVFAAGTTSSITAGQHINAAAQGNSLHLAKAGIGLFTYGKEADAASPNQETGLRLHAASGKLSTQSQSGPTRLTADKLVTVASVNANVNVAAKDHVLLTAQGAYIKLEGGNIEVHGPGTMAFKASVKEFTGPRQDVLTLPNLPKASTLENYMELNYRWDDMQPMVGAPYSVVFDTGVTVTGKLDARGFSRLGNIPAGAAKASFGEDERDAVQRKVPRPNALFGSRAVDADDAAELLEKFLTQEDVHYKENYFPDEIRDIAASVEEDSELLYEFHYGDYRYNDEIDEDQSTTERTYRELHDANPDLSQLAGEDDA